MLVPGSRDTVMAGLSTNRPVPVWGGRCGTFCDLDRILPPVRKAALNRAFEPAAHQQGAGAIAVESNEGEKANAWRKPDNRVGSCLVPKRRRERRAARRGADALSAGSQGASGSST